MRLILLFLNLCLVQSFRNSIFSKKYSAIFSSDYTSSSNGLENKQELDKKGNDESSYWAVANNLKRLRRDVGGGFDQRDVGKTCLEKIYDQVRQNNTLNKLRKYNYQMNLLKKLENVGTSDFEKLRAIEEYNYVMESSKYVANIEKGGLYNDWNNIF